MNDDVHVMRSVTPGSVGPVWGNEGNHMNDGPTDHCSDWTLTLPTPALCGPAGHSLLVNIPRPRVTD